MGLLKSVDNVPGIHYYEYRDSSYYNKYEYRMRVSIPCVRYVWWCNTESELDKRIKNTKGGYGSIRRDDLATVIEHTSALKTVINLQNQRKKSKDFGMRIEGGVVAFFSSNLSTLQDIEKKLGPSYDCDFTQVQTAPYAGVKYFVNEPTHKFRVYLKSKRVDDNFHIEFKKTLDRNKTLYPSPALRRWLTNEKNRYGIWYFRWTSSAHFIDYDDESTLSYIGLMHGEVLGKKYKLEKRPNNI